MVGIAKKQSVDEWLRSNQTILVAALCIVGVLVRAVCFGSIPAGLNVDEAFSGYEAYSLLHYGVDSAGYHAPVYFVTWGSGMSALVVYLVMPCIALLGRTELAVRLPQLILACISLPIFYLSLKKLFSERTALAGLALLAISPWHIMMSRWGIDANLAPAFLLFGFFFLLKGREKSGYWLISAVMYGLALYTYSITWLVVPLTLLCFFGYFLYTRQKMPVRTLFAAGCILFVFALPLLLFLLVNKGFLSEIRTPLFSIPKLVVMRDSDLSLRNFIDPYQLLLSGKQILGLGDSFIFDTIRPFGMYYLFSVPFILLGYGCLCVRVVKSLWQRRFDPAALVLIGAAVSAIVVILVSDVNVVRSNYLHLWTIMVLTLGLRAFVQLLHERRLPRIACITLYAAAFMVFIGYYFTAYIPQSASAFRPGLGECIACLKEQDAQTVVVDGSVPHSVVLFYDELPSPEYCETVIYKNWPDPYLAADSFSGYVFADDMVHPGDAEACIVPLEQEQEFAQNGYETACFGIYCAAWRPD